MEYLVLADSVDGANRRRGEETTWILQHRLGNDLLDSTIQQEKLTDIQRARGNPIYSAIADTGASWCVVGLGWLKNWPPSILLNGKSRECQY